VEEIEVRQQMAPPVFGERSHQGPDRDIEP
jgi:hypothetical protein